jgi:hypothetical protein
MKAKYYRRGQGETGITCATMNENEGTVFREAWPDGSTYNERTNGAKGKTTDGQGEDMSGNEKGELDGQETVLPTTYQSNLTLRVTTPTVPDPILRYASGERGGPGRVPRDRDGDEGRTANDMKTILRHHGLGGTRRRYGAETSARSGGESTAVSGPGEGRNE